MVYPYVKITPKIIRPLIPIVIRSSRDKFVYYPALVDSGSDHCIFSIEIAKELDIRLSKKRTEFIGIGKDKLFGYLGKTDIRIGKRSILVDVIFAEISAFGHGILGQNGLFSNFDVNFSYRREIVDIV